MRFGCRHPIRSCRSHVAPCEAHSKPAWQPVPTSDVASHVLLSSRCQLCLAVLGPTSRSASTRFWKSGHPSALNSGLVGRGGLEPPTSRLSSARSNQLSYRPQMSVISHQNKDSAVPWHWWSLSGSNRRPSACKADALPAELRPQLPVRPVSPGPRRRSEVSSRARRLRWPRWGQGSGSSVRPALALQSRCSPS